MLTLTYSAELQRPFAHLRALITHAARPAGRFPTKKTDAPLRCYPVYLSSPPLSSSPGYMSRKFRKFLFFCSCIRSLEQSRLGVGVARIPDELPSYHRTQDQLIRLLIPSPNGLERLAVAGRFRNICGGARYRFDRWSAGRDERGAPAGLLINLAL